MFPGLVTIILVDAILFIVIRMVDTQWKSKKQSVPISYAVILFVLCVIAHYAATNTMGRAIEQPYDIWKVQLSSAVFGFVPVAAYVHMLFSRISEETQKVRTEAYPRAKALRVEGNIEGALREYLKYFEQYPGSPRPLFSAAGMLEQEKQFEKAATLFSRIMVYFAQDDPVWTRAAYRLVFLRDHHLNDKDGAAQLRAQIEERIPEEERAKFASRDLEQSSF